MTMIQIMYTYYQILNPKKNSKTIHPHHHITTTFYDNNYNNN